MKKYLLTSFLFLLAYTSFSQEFLGIKVGGTTTECVTKLKTKGFKYISKSGNVTEMKGLVNNINMQLFIVETPLSKKVWKFSIYLPEIKNWYNLKSEYLDYKKTLTEKYGEPEQEFDYFTSPYYEGDGYELSALRIEKCVYSAYWKNVNLEISKYSQVRISYENTDNSALDTQEKEKLNKNTF